MSFATTLLFVSPLLQSLSASELSPHPEKIRRAFTDWAVKPLSQLNLPDSTPAQVELGQNLFFDKVLSGNKNISCATCHHPLVGSGDGLPLSFGEGGIGLGPMRRQASSNVIPRNAPPIFDMAYLEVRKLMWDGRIGRNFEGHFQTPEPLLNGTNPKRTDITHALTSSLAAQALFPVTSHDEMRGQIGSNDIADATNNEEVWLRLMTRLMSISDYRELFRQAFPEIENEEDFNFGHAASAIAAFEAEAFSSEGSRFDQFLKGDLSQLSEREISGAKIFLGKGQCIQCHNGPLLTDFQFHSIGAPQLGPGKSDTDDLGLGHLTNRPEDNYKFKTPTLRNVAFTGPWSHSGAFNSLEQVILHHVAPYTSYRSLMSHPQNFLPYDFLELIDFDEIRFQERVQSFSSRLYDIHLSQQEIDALIDFLHALSNPASINRYSLIPYQVPSGLPVSDE